MLYIQSAITALPLTLALLMALKHAAARIGLVDHPGGRKHHRAAVPVVGGIAMYLGLLVGSYLALGAGHSYEALLIGGGLLVFIGVLDDRFHIHHHPRFAIQIIAALIMVYSGGLSILSVGNPFSLGVLELAGPLSLLLTVLITITVINAFNFIDGLDGLAGSLAFVSLLAIAVATNMAGGNPQVLVLAAVLGGVVLAFLAFNLPMGTRRPASLFMGDAGSMLLGFCIVWLTTQISQGEGAVISPVVGLWFAVIPIFDLFTCFILRSSRGKSPFRPGREHFHYILRRGGFSSGKVLMILVGLNVLYASIGLLGIYYGIADWILFWGWIAVGSTQLSLFRYVAARYRLSVRRNGTTSIVI